MIVPHYRRGESEAGFVARCISNREMRRLPFDPAIKRQICKEHVAHAREYLRQPFNTKED